MTDVANKDQGEAAASAPEALRTIKVTVDGDTVRIALARPEHLNPLDWATLRELRAAMEMIERRPELRFVTLTGVGRSFSAGGDLDAYVQLYERPDDFAAFLEDFHQLLAIIERAPQIVIALVNGICVAGGLELLLACDLAIAVEEARIGDGHLNFGQLPGAGGSQRLSRAIGLLRAKHMILTGVLVSAVEAERLGLVNAIVPAGKLDAAGDALIASLREKSPTGLAGAKHLANLVRGDEFTSGVNAEMAYVHRYATTDPDAREGLAAFRDKRRPEFGRGVRSAS